MRFEVSLALKARLYQPASGKSCKTGLQIRIKMKALGRHSVFRFSWAPAVPSCSPPIAIQSGKSDLDKAS